MAARRSGRPSRWNEPHVPQRDLGFTPPKASKKPQLFIRPQVDEDLVPSLSSRSSNYSPPSVTTSVMPRILAHPYANAMECDKIVCRDPRHDLSKAVDDSESKGSTPMAPWNEHQIGSLAMPYVIDSEPEDEESDDELPPSHLETTDPCDNYGCKGFQ